MPGPVASPGLRSSPFIETPEVLVSRADSRLPHLAPVALRDLPAPRLILPGPGNARRQSIEDYLTSQGIRAARIVELDAMLGTLDMVAAHGWLTILPGVMMADDDRAPRPFTVSPLGDPPRR